MTKKKAVTVWDARHGWNPKYVHDAYHCSACDVGSWKEDWKKAGWHCPICGQKPLLRAKLKKVI